MMNRAVTRFVTHGTQVTSISDAGLPYSEAGLPLEIGAAYAPQLSIVAMQWLRGLAAPLYHRLVRGEGGLLIVNATLALKLYPVREALSLVAISFVSLLSLYLFNDVIDARDDRQNPKKDRVNADMYFLQRRTFLVIWSLMTGFGIAAGAFLSLRTAVWVFIVSLINIGYSLFWKRVRIVDVSSVGLWGAAYASIVTDVPAWIVMVGAMTSVCHIYQTSEDRDADTGNGIATSATLAVPMLSLLQAGLAVILVATAWMLGASLMALTFAGFLAYWLTWRERPQVAWILSKVHFSIIWAYLLMRV